jgi:hypothetical protein
MTSGRLATKSSTFIGSGCAPTRRSAPAMEASAFSQIGWSDPIKVAFHRGQRDVRARPARMSFSRRLSCGSSPTSISTFRTRRIVAYPAAGRPVRRGSLPASMTRA